MLSHATSKLGEV